MTKVRDERLAFAALLGLWVLIELLHSSHWLKFDTLIPRTQARPNGETSAAARDLLPARGRVWFAPYTTFPETGMVESRLRRGVYDTFLAFPDGGITSNYGAFKLSAADSAFAQVSASGLDQEAALAQKLGYQWFAVDLGALQEPAGMKNVCLRTKGCRISSDGYALLPLTAPERWRPSDLSGFPRNIPDLPQTSASPRWGSLVFEPGSWWTPSSNANGGSTASMTVWTKPVWKAAIYRFDPAMVPVTLRGILAAPGERIWLRLAPGIQGVDLCLRSKKSRLKVLGSSPCRAIKLRQATPRVEITSLLRPGQVTEIDSEWIYGPEGVPITVGILPPPAAPMPGASAFAVEVENATSASRTRSITSAHGPRVR